MTRHQLDKLTVSMSNKPLGKISNRSLIFPVNNLKQRYAVASKPGGNDAGCVMEILGG